MVATVIGCKYVKDKIQGTDKEYEGYNCHLGTEDPDWLGLFPSRKFLNKKLLGAIEPLPGVRLNIEVDLDGKVKSIELVE